MKAIYLIYESDGKSSTSKRVLIGVCTERTLEGLVGEIECCDDFTDSQIDKIYETNFCEGNINSRMAWNIDSDGNDASLYIARYPASQVSFDLNGIL